MIKISIVNAKGQWHILAKLYGSKETTAFEKWKEVQASKSKVVLTFKVEKKPKRDSFGSR